MREISSLINDVKDLSKAFLAVKDIALLRKTFLNRFESCIIITINKKLSDFRFDYVIVISGKSSRFEENCVIKDYVIIITNKNLKDVALLRKTFSNRFKNYIIEAIDKKLNKSRFDCVIVINNKNSRFEKDYIIEDYVIIIINKSSSFLNTKKT